MLLRVTSVKYSEIDGELAAVVTGRGEDGDRHCYHVFGTYPEAYVPSTELADVESTGKVVGEDYGYESIYGDELKKLRLDHPQSTNDVVEEYSKSFESDIPYYRKLSIRDGLSGYVEMPMGSAGPRSPCRVDLQDVKTDIDRDDVDEIEPRVAIGDIEVRVGDEPFEEMRENATQPVIAITLWDSYENDYTCLVLDEDKESIGTRIRQYLEDHWEETDLAEDYLDVDINLVRCGDEVSLLKEFCSYVQTRGIDLLSGWNWVNFDHVYLLRRIADMDGVFWNQVSDIGTVSGRQLQNEYGAPERAIDGLPGFDMMDALCEKLTFSEWRSKSLDYVANELLDVGKVEDVDINHSWEKNIEKLIAYNIIDVQLCVALDRARDIHTFFYDLAAFSSIQIYDTFSELRLVDGYIMSRRDDDEILPEASEVEVSNAGGYVHDSSRGIKENIAVVDVKSLYPSAIITWNISTETLTLEPDDPDLHVPWVPEPKDVVGGIEADNVDEKWAGTSLEREGVIPKYLKTMFAERAEKKRLRNQYDHDEPEHDKYDNQQRAVKVIMNSVYGCSASPYWRLSKEGIGDAVTSVARYTLWAGLQSAEQNGYTPLYADTDSAFLEIGDEDSSLEELVEEGYEIEDAINADMDGVASRIGLRGDHPYLVDSDLHGTDRHCLVWEFEKLYQRFIQVGQKKRYAGTITWKEGETYDEPEVSVSGFESQRADSPEVVEDIQPDVIDMILRGGGFSEVSEYIRDKIDEMKDPEANKRKFAMPGSLNKPPEEYPNREIPRAVIYSNENLGYDFREGDDPFVYPVNQTPPDKPTTDFVALQWNEDVPDGFELNYEKMMEKAMSNPLDSIINEVGWEFEELKSGMKTGSVDVDADSDDPFANRDSMDTEDDSGGGVLDF